MTDRCAVGSARTGRRPGVDRVRPGARCAGKSVCSGERGVSAEYATYWRRSTLARLIPSLPASGTLVLLHRAGDLLHRLAWPVSRPELKGCARSSLPSTSRSPPSRNAVFFAGQPHGRQTLLEHVGPVAVGPHPGHTLLWRATAPWISAKGNRFAQLTFQVWRRRHLPAARSARAVFSELGHFGANRAFLAAGVIPCATSPPLCARAFPPRAARPCRALLPRSPRLIAFSSTGVVEGLTDILRDESGIAILDESASRLKRERGKR